MNLPTLRKPSADDALLQQALKQLESAQKHASDVNARKDRAHQVYLGQTNPDYGKKRNERDPRDWRSRMFPRVAGEHAELKIAELCDSEPEFEAKARLRRDQALAGAWNLAVDAYLDLDDFGATFRTIIRRDVIEGSCPVKIIMTQDYGSDHPRPTIIPIPYEDWLPEPTARRCCDMAWAWHRWKATLQDLRAATDDQGNPLYKNLDELAPKPGAGDATDRQRPNETSEQYDARTTGLHTIYERWTPWGVLAIANKKTVIRHDEDYENPIFEDEEIPFEVIRIIEDVGNLDGVSTMLNIEYEQENYWKHLNEFNNGLTLATRPPKLVDTELDPNSPKYAQLYPDQVIPTRNGEQTVKIMVDVSNISQYPMRDMLEMDRDHIERATGMNSTVAGMANANSATESSSNLAQAKSRTRLEIQQSDGDLCRAIKKFASRIHQYCEPAEVVEFTNGVDLSHAPFNGRFTTKLESSRALREQRQNTLMTIWNAIQPQIQQGAIEFSNIQGLLQAIESAFGIDSLGVQSKSNDQVVAEQQQHELAMEQAQQSLQLQGQLVSQQQQAQLQAQLQVQAPPPPEQAPPPEQSTPLHESLNMAYDKLPPSLQRQAEAMAGFKPATAAEGAAQLAALKPAPAAKPASKPGGSSGAKGS